MMRLLATVLLLLAGTAHANLMILSGGGGETVAAPGTNAARIAAVIALSTNYVEPSSFTLDRPADPVTTATVGGTDVDTCAEIQSAVGTAENEVTIPAGTYGSWPSSACDLTLDASDVDVIATGVTINGDLRIGTGGTGTRPARIRWTGGTVNGIFEIEKGTDFLVDNLSSVNDQTVTGQHGNVWTGGEGDGTNPNKERFAVINSTLSTQNADAGGGWTIFLSAPATSPPAAQIDSHTDWFMGNVEIINDPAQNFRVHDFRDAVWVGVAWNPTGEFDPTVDDPVGGAVEGAYVAGSANGPRIESEIEGLYIVDSWAIGSTITDNYQDPSLPLINLDYVHFVRLHSSQNAFSNNFNGGESGGADTGSTVNDSTYYHRPGTGGSVGGEGGEVDIGNATGSGNTISAAWDGTNADALTIITAESLDWIVGADH